MTVSVCIISAGRVELLDALDSLGKQTLAPTEVLVLIDGDRQFAEQIALEYPNANVGVVSGFTLGGCRNQIVERSSGDLILFIDDDVVVPTEFVAHLVRLAESIPEVDVFGGPNLTLPEAADRERLVGELLASPWVTGPFSRRFRADVPQSNNLEDLVLCNLAIRRSAWQPFLDSLPEGEETEFLYRLVGENHRVVTTSDMSVWHRRRLTTSGLFEQMRRYGRGRSEAARAQPQALRPILLGLGGLATAVFVARRHFPLTYLMWLASQGLLRGIRLGDWRRGVDSVAFILTIQLGYPVGVVEGLMRPSSRERGDVMWITSPSAGPPE